MKFGYILYIFILFHSFDLIAQNQNIEKYIYELNSAKSDIDKLNLHKKIGDVYLEQMVYKKAIEHYSIILTPPYFNHLTSNEDIIKIYKLKVFCYEQNNDIENQIKTINSLIEIIDKKLYFDEYFKLLKSLSILYFKINQLDQVISVNEKLLIICPASNIEEQINIYNNLGFAYLKNQKKEISRAYFEKCFNLYQKFEKQLNLETKISILANMAIMYNSIGQLDKCNTLLLDAFNYAKQSGSVFQIGKINNLRATYFYNSLNDTDKAKLILLENIDLLNQKKDESKVENELLKSYECLSDIYLESKNYKKHIKYNKLFQSIKEESLNRLIKSSQIQLENQLVLEKKEADINKMIAEKEIKEASLREEILEQEKLEKELLLKLKVVENEKQKQELETQFLKNKILAEEKIHQLNKIIKEKNFTQVQLQKIHLLQKEKKLKELRLQKNKKEIELLRVKNLSNQLIIRETESEKKSFFLVIVLLFIIVVLTVVFYLKMKKRKEQLSFKIIELDKAQNQISEQYLELKRVNDNLEKIVDNRTKYLSNVNNQLMSSNAQLEQFSFILAHNIKGPIARLVGLGYLANTEIENLNDEKKFVLNKISETVNDLQAVISDLNVLLDVKTGFKDQKESINLNELIHKIIKGLLDSNPYNDVKINVFIDDEISIYSIKSYIESIIYNLLSNGIKYKRTGIDSFVTIKIVNVDNYVRLTVEDNGLGIDLKLFNNKIFGLYQRFHSHVTGKGLGLYILKLQVEALQGTVKIESTPNLGSKFIVEMLV